MRGSPDVSEQPVMLSRLDQALSASTEPRPLSRTGVW